MKRAIIIPARYESKRFPGKILALIEGLPMIQHVYQQCQKSSADVVIIATDDDRIKEACMTFEADVRMTKKTHKSGTERCIEVAKDLDDFDLIMNVQGDEPLIDPLAIDELFEFSISSKAQIATLVTPLYDLAALHNPNIVKCVCTKGDKALYFSRAPIPFDRGSQFPGSQFNKHVGIYVFRKDILVSLENIAVSQLEQIEKLEQLKWLENDFTIRVLSTKYNSVGVDTIEDLELVTKLMRR